MRAAEGALGEHRKEGARIRDAHQLIDVAGRFDAAARALRALVRGRAQRLDDHGAEDDGKEDHEQSPARAITA